MTRARRTVTGPEVTAAMKAEDVDAALVEKACHARWDAEGSVFTGHFGDVARTWDALAALFPAEAEVRRTVERHALAAVLPEIQAQAEARLADLTARIGFGDGVTEPQADNDTIVKAVNEAFTNSNTLWEVEEQVERVRALADHYEARQGTALGRVSTGNVAASIRRALGPQDPQIATQEPAERTQGGSGGREASGGLVEPCCDHQAMEYGNCSDCLNTGHAHSPETPCRPTEDAP